MNQSTAADHVLLFGMVAVQVQAISQEQLVDGLKVWMKAKHRKLSDVLVELGTLEADQVDGIDTLVAAQIIREGNAVQSMASCDAYQSFRERLEEVRDRDIEATLLLSDTAREGRLEDAAPSAGSSSSLRQRFEVVRFHDEGGLGRVFEAHDSELNRNVALKEIKAMFADDIESRQRFVMEAEITGRLEHPGIVPVYGLGRYDDGRPFYAMRFIHGDSFREAIRDFHHLASTRDAGDQSLELRKLLTRFLDVCNAINYAHRRGILHRDIKPSNIMLGDFGETLVVDWGLAKPVGERDESLPAVDTHDSALLPASSSTIAPTVIGRAVGSPPYMSPEQARGEHLELGPGTDIYSLGATLYTLLTNETPYKGDSSEEILRKVRQAKLLPPIELNAKVPGALNAICLKAMAAESSDRYQSVDQLRDDIERYLADEPVTAYAEPLRERLFRYGRRHVAMMQFAMIALLLFATIALAYALAMQSQASELLSRQSWVRLAEVEFANVLNSGQKPAEMSAAELELLNAKILGIVNSMLSGRPLAEASFAASVAKALEPQGVYGMAEQWARRAVELRTGRLGPDNQETIFSRLMLARALHGLGKFDEALKEYTEIHERFSVDRGPADRHTLSATNNIATLHRSLGNYELAIKLFEELAEQRQVLYGEEDERTLRTRNNVALTLIDMNRSDRALPILEELLALRLKTVDKTDPLAMRVMNNMGIALTRVGRHEGIGSHAQGDSGAAQSRA